MSLPDTIFIFALALVIFGPKKLPEIGRQIGKLVFEFRRASNEFKLQIEEELRAAELADKQKKLAETPAPEIAAAVSPKEAMIVRPPSTGVTVSTEGPSRVVPVDEEVATLKDISAETPLAATAAEGLENPLPPTAPEGEIGTRPMSDPTQEPAMPDFPALPSTAETHLASGPPQTSLDSTNVQAESAAVPVLEEAAVEAAAPATAETATGSRLEAALSAEEHIREQIAIHHG